MCPVAGRLPELFFGRVTAQFDGKEKARALAGRANRGNWRMSLRNRFSTACSVLALTAVAIPAGATETQTYTYDVDGRLVIVQYAGGTYNGQAHSTCYDPADNRVRYKSDSAGAVATCPSTPAPTPSPTPTPSNRPPVANPDNAGNMGKCIIKYVNVTANDADPDGDALSVISAVASGDMFASVFSASTVQIDSGQTAGAKTISYTISDGRGGTSSSTISVTVLAGVCN